MAEDSLVHKSQGKERPGNSPLLLPTFLTVALLVIAAEFLGGTARFERSFLVTETSVGRSGEMMESDGVVALDEVCEVAVAG